MSFIHSDAFRYDIFRLISGLVRFLLMIIQISAGMSISYLVLAPVARLWPCGDGETCPVEVSEYLVDPDVPIDERMEVFRYYGTCTKTLLTMFEAAGGIPRCLFFGFWKWSILCCR